MLAALGATAVAYKTRVVATPLEVLVLDDGSTDGTADVALAAAAGDERLRSLDLLSPFPRQVAGTPAERLYQPLAMWTWISSSPVLDARADRRHTGCSVNGRFVVVDRGAYAKAGGHGASPGTPQAWRAARSQPAASASGSGRTRGRAPGLDRDVLRADGRHPVAAPPRPGGVEGPARPGRARAGDGTSARTALTPRHPLLYAEHGRLRAVPGCGG